MSSVLVVCCNPACSGRSVEGETVNRATWEATWRHNSLYQGDLAPEWVSGIHCPCCKTEGIDPESGQLDSAEEELGVRCKCGIVSTEGQMIAVEKPPGWPFPVIGRCPYCLEVILAPGTTWKDIA